MKPNNTDTAVDAVVRAQQGDADAFEALIRLYEEGLRTLAYRLLGPNWTEDILQEAYLKAFRALPDFSASNGSIGGWFYRIVYRTCIDELRRVKRRTWMPLESAAQEPAQEPSPEDVVVQRDRVRSALTELGEEHRAVVVLVDELGFDYAATAAILEIPRGTVASRLNYARGLLRRVLQPSATETESTREGAAHE